MFWLIIEQNVNQIIWLTVIFFTLITIFRTVISTTYNKLAHYKKHLKKVFNLAKWNEATTAHLKKTPKKKRLIMSGLGDTKLFGTLGKILKKTPKKQPKNMYLGGGKHHKLQPADISKQSKFFHKAGKVLNNGSVIGKNVVGISGVGALAWTCLNYSCEGKPAYLVKKGWYHATGFNVDNPHKKFTPPGGDGPKIYSVLESMDYTNLLMFLALIVIILALLIYWNQKRIRKELYQFKEITEKGYYELGDLWIYLYAFTLIISLFSIYLMNHINYFSGEDFETIKKIIGFLMGTNLYLGILYYIVGRNSSYNSIDEIEGYQNQLFPIFHTVTGMVIFTLNCALFVWW